MSSNFFCLKCKQYKSFNDMCTGGGVNEKDAMCTRYTCCYECLTGYEKKAGWRTHYIHKESDDEKKEINNKIR